ncbi:MAG: hypothetical protein AB1631_30465 [Acidobacteriota bacterium]
MKLKHSLFLLLTISCSFAFAIQDQDENDPARAAALIRLAIKTRGGDAYLNIRSLIGRGQYTLFEKGASGIPQSFIDYIVYPDRERTEFGKGDTKFIQSNSTTANWVYDAPQKMIRDQTEEQVKDFQQGIRRDIDNVLRRSWQEPGAKLVYLGRREAWKNTFSEAVRIEYQDGSTVTLHFDMRSHLPLMSEYTTVVEGKTVENQVRFFLWVELGGIQFPMLQDFYRGGQQSGRVAYESVEFNPQIPDKLFNKPASIKEVK